MSENSLLRCWEIQKEISACVCVTQREREKEREMGRSPCCSKEGMNRGAWTAFEDKTLTDYINIHGEGKWRNLPKRAGLNRCGKSCRLRWLNYLKPDIKRGNITSDEEDLIIRLHNLLGNRWSLIAGRLPGRTDNEIKNYWNTNITKKLKGNPTSTSNPKLSKSPSKQSLSPTILRCKSHPPSQGKEARAIRTKASRCTQLLYDQCVHLGSTSLNRENLHCDVAVGSRPLDDDGSPFAWKDLQLSDFMMDFDLNDKFISDFLNTEVFDPKTSYLSPNSNENLLFPSEMTPLSDSSLDWPQDQR